MIDDELEITWEEIASVKETYRIIDIRDSVSVSYGKVAGAWAISPRELMEQVEELRSLDMVALYCMHGIESLRLAKQLREAGVNAYSLKGGYAKWLQMRMEQEPEEDICEKIESGIRKRYHKKLFSKFAKAINTYQLVQENDRIAVCISGGKDSMLMAKLFQELQRHRKFPFELVFLVMDPGYSAANRKAIEYNAKILGIPITIFESEIFNVVDEVDKSPCYLCARMRRGHLYSKAKELGCNKIALGHHYDDVIETILMGMLYGGQIQSMMPKLHSTNFPGMELIRPLYPE